MQGVSSDLGRFKKRGVENKRYLHTPAHLVADELSRLLSDPAHFGAYLKLALTHNHDQLRKIAQEVLEQKNVKSKPKLFMFLVKKNTNHP